MNIASEKYFWMFTESQLQFMNSPPLTENTNLARAVHGSAIMAKSSGKDLLQGTRFYDAYTLRFSELWNSEAGWKYLQSKIPQSTLLTRDLIEGSEPSPFELFLYEAVVAMCLASCDAAEKASSSFFTAKELYDSFTGTTFDGAYGRVSFDRKTGDRIGDNVRYAVYNIVSNETSYNIKATHQQAMKDEKKEVLDDIYSTSRQMVWETWPNGNFMDRLSTENLMVETKHPQVFEKEKKQGIGGIYSMPRKNITWKTVLNRKFIYADGTSNPPDNLPPIKIVSNCTTEVVITLTLCGITLILSIGCTVWTYIYRKTKVVRASQPFFLYMLCIGTALKGASLTPLSLEAFHLGQDILNGTCISYPWLTSLGSFIEYSALFSKTMRVYKLMVAGGRFRRAVVRPLDVMRPFFALISIALILLITWTVVSPAVFAKSPGSSVDQFGRVNSYHYKCSWKDDEKKTIYTTLFYVDTVYPLVALLILAYYAYRTRNVSTEYNESTWIGLIIYIHLQYALFDIIISVFETDWEGASILGSSFIRSFDCLTTLFLIFVPKMIALRNEKKEKLERETKKKERLERLRRFDALKKEQEDEAAGIARGPNTPLVLETQVQDELLTDENNGQSDDDEGYGIKIAKPLDLNEEIEVSLSEVLTENELLRESINSKRPAIVNASSLYEEVN